MQASYDGSDRMRSSLLLFMSVALAQSPAEDFARSKVSEWPDAYNIAKVETHFDSDTLVFERTIGDTLWASAGLWQVLVYYAIVRENRQRLNNPDTVLTEGYQELAIGLLTDMERNYYHAKKHADL